MRRVLLVALAAVIVGCGGSKTDSQQVQPTASPKAAATQPSPSYSAILLSLNCTNMAGYGHAEGVIRNSGSSPLWSLTPVVVFRDASGKPIASGTGWSDIANLSAGQETPFLAQTLIPIGTFTDCDVQFQATDKDVLAFIAEAGDKGALTAMAGGSPESFTVPLVDDR